MAAPATPTNVYVQQGNSQVYLSWDLSSGATSYSVQRSTDGVSYSVVGTPSVPNYLDTTVTVGTQYYYQVASVNGSGTSVYSSAQSITPSKLGVMSLGQVRLLSQQEADMVGSNFVSLPEWNTYINQSYFELYDLLVTSFEDYYAKNNQLTTDGSTQYTLPDDFYKLLGVDIGLSSSANARVTLRKFDFIERNRYVYPQIQSTYLGVFNLRYRLVGNTLYFIPTPQSGQTITYWYIPRMTQLLKDSDMLDGISGWTEYVVVDAAIKALTKEESDPSALMARKMALKQRIEETAMNRDVGQPDTISDISISNRWGCYPNGDGPVGGW
jgi:hypothetical protein